MNSNMFDLQTFRRTFLEVIFCTLYGLSYRIALLRTEEQKAMGKINETQARAKEILEIKRRNETNLQERFSHTLQVILYQIKTMCFHQ